MAKICDRTPCDGLLDALGKYIFGARDDSGEVMGFIVRAAIPSPRPQAQASTKNMYVKRAFEIEYCPFCGTRIEEVNAQVVAKYTRPRGAKRRSKYGYE